MKVEKFLNLQCSTPPDGFSAIRGHDLSLTGHSLVTAVTGFKENVVFFAERCQKRV